MKLVIASDIHGSEKYCKALVERFYDEGADKLVLLGDVLYHGPRNDLPDGYLPKGVIALLNPLSDKILCVKGNCDGEVDGMVLDFPVLAEYGYIYDGKREIYLVHGHNIERNFKTLPKGALLFFGHTHIPEFTEKDGAYLINPGSVSIPKESSPHSYILYDGESVVWKDVETGKEYKRENI